MTVLHLTIPIPVPPWRLVAAYLYVGTLMWLMVEMALVRMWRRRGVTYRPKIASKRVVIGVTFWPWWVGQAIHADIITRRLVRDRPSRPPIQRVTVR